MTRKTVTRIKFVSTISKMGDKRIIVIPKDYHKDLEEFTPRQIKVTVDDEL